MAQTRRKRRTKHRGTPAGTIEARGRTGRPPSPEERKKQTRVSAREARLNKPPTWKSSLIRALIAAAIVFVFMIVVSKGKNRVSAALGFTGIALLIYIPVGYYLELFLYRRRQRGRAAGSTKADTEMIDVRMFTVGPVQENSFIVRQKGSDRGVIVDPGDEADRLLEAINSLGLEIEGILVTHTHFDHIGAVAPVARATGAPVWCPEIERGVLANIMDYVPWPGFGPFESYEADHTVKGGEALELAGMSIDVIFTPGPQPRSCHLRDRGRRRAVLRRRSVPGIGGQGGPPRRGLADAAVLD